MALAIATGASNKEAALDLRITERIVKAHVSFILSKLQLRDRVQPGLVISSRHRHS